MPAAYPRPRLPPELLDPPLFEDDEERPDEEDDELLEPVDLPPPPLLEPLAWDDDRLRDAEEPEPLERLLDADDLDPLLPDLRTLPLADDERELLDAAALTWRFLEADDEELETRRLEADADEDEGGLRELDA